MQRKWSEKRKTDSTKGNFYWHCDLLQEPGLDAPWLEQQMSQISQAT